MRTERRLEEIEKDVDDTFDKAVRLGYRRGRAEGVLIALASVLLLSTVLYVLSL